MGRIGFFGVAAAVLLAGGMPRTGTAATPYTHQNFLNDPEEFRFAVIPDRSGGDWRGAWTNALAKVNLLRPDFVITVGDLMEGSVPADKTREQAFREQHAELAEQLKGVVPPFYSVVGNHDIHYNDPDGLTRRLWKEHWGENTYYSFLYKNVLFIAIDSMEKDGVSAAQYDWMAKTLRENAGVRWTFLFLHRPDIWGTAAWKAFEQGALKDRRYTVFAGDLHTYFHVRRNGNDYYALATAGGDSASNGQNPAKVMKLNGLAYGEMDHIAWVTVAKDGPHIANLVLDGIVEADYLGIETTKATTLTSDLNDPPVPAATANAARNAARRKERFYKWSCDGFDDWKAADAASAAAWTLADGTVRFDATKGPVALRFGKACTDFDLHYQYRLEKGSEARVVYVDDTPGDTPVEYVIADGLCRPDEWTHGRVSVTGNVITFEIGGVVSKKFTRRTENPSGHFELRGLSGKGAFRRFYGFDLGSENGVKR